MKLIDTLSKTQKIDMLKGNLVGIFNTLILPTDSYYKLAKDLCLGYYSYRSGLKTISPTYKMIQDILNEHETYETFVPMFTEAFFTDNDELLKVLSLQNELNADIIMGALIRGKYCDKWDRIYKALVEEQYNVLFTKDYNYSKTGNNEDIIQYDTEINDTIEYDTVMNDTTEYDTVLIDTTNYDTKNTEKIDYGKTETSTLTKTGSVTETITYDNETENHEETETNKTTTTNNNSEHFVAGFDNIELVTDSKDIDNNTVTDVGNKENNFSNNNTKKTGDDTTKTINDTIDTNTLNNTGSDNIEKSHTGTDSTSKTHTGTDSTVKKHTGTDTTVKTHTGTDNKSYSINETTTFLGRDGNASDLIDKELNLRNTQIFFDIVYKDIDSMTTLSIYL